MIPPNTIQLGAAWINGRTFQALLEPGPNGCLVTVWDDALEYAPGRRPAFPFDRMGRLAGAPSCPAGPDYVAAAGIFVADVLEALQHT